MNTLFFPLAPLLRGACLLCLTMMALAGMASAVANEALERGVWRDDTGGADWATAREAPYAPMGRMLTGGYTSAVHWLRVLVPPSEAAHKLRLRPAFIDELDVYDDLMLTAEGKAHREAPIARLGDRQLLSRMDSSSGLSGFATIPPHAEARFVYIRVASTSTQIVHLELVTAAEAINKERAYDLTVGVYLGLLTMFAFWALAQLTLSFDRLIFAYVVKQVVDILYVAGFTGLTNYSLVALGWQSWAELADMGFSLVVLLVVSTAIWFHAQVIREFAPPRWVLGFLYAGLAMLPIGLMLMASGHTRLALSTNTTLAGVLPLIVLLGVFTARAFKDPMRRDTLPATRAQLIVIYGLIAVLLWVAVTPALGALGGSESQLHGFLVHGLFTSGIMLIFLMSRARRQDNVQRQTLARLADIEKEIQLANIRREQQSQFINMLVHELKTPLSVVKMVLGSGRRTPTLVQSAESAIQSMSAVIERCKQAEMLESNAVEVEFKTPVQLGALFLELGDRHGLRHRMVIDVPDEALIQTDFELLRVIISNLLDNARRYSPMNSDVLVSARLSLQETVAGWKIDVRNQPGLHGQPDPALVFTKFYRHAKAHQETGSGLGLYLVAQFAKMLGGWARYRTELPYLVFTVWLPR